ncbi:VOC family protein [Plantactinospora sp. CA-290183]|uniref:VOC family protein n=1 Tax=Plantactinospora sp. CA-290183 TaxID=3240006 RepID=UPI003D8D9273
MLDHIVFAVPDLAGAVAGFERLTGVRPVRGGSHVGLGTANHLVGLGGAAYLEIIGPDPDQPDPVQPRPFGIDGLTASRVVTWSIRPPDLDHAVAAVIARGYDPGPPRTMSRRTSDGNLLTWRLTPGADDPADGLVPFLIDWGTTAHPTTGALPTLPLRSLQAQHPDPGPVRKSLAALDVDLLVGLGRQSQLVVTLQGPDRPIVLS